ncbi:MAG: hypothetical protein Q7V88_07600 [Actinomycetota bacterium]|nr:hypothetical protein [Actinomycetota bacterium]
MTEQPAPSMGLPPPPPPPLPPLPPVQAVPPVLAVPPLHPAPRRWRLALVVGGVAVVAAIVWFATRSGDGAAGSGYLPGGGRRCRTAELAEYGITANGVAPGTETSDMPLEFASATCDGGWAAVRFIDSDIPDAQSLWLIDLGSHRVRAEIGMPYFVTSHVLWCLDVPAEARRAFETQFLDVEDDCNQTEFNDMVSTGAIQLP